MTTPITNSKTIEAFVSANMNLLGNLWARWQDEKEYEDINEYGKAIAAKFPEGWKLLKSTKRPFGVAFSIGTEEWILKITSASLNWKRTK